MEQSAVKERALLGIEPFLGETNFKTTLSMGTLADNAETSYPGKRGHFNRHSL